MDRIPAPVAEMKVLKDKIDLGDYDTLAQTGMQKCST